MPVPVVGPLKERRARGLAILEEASAAVDGWSCPASTECCHFGAREPWLTKVEFEIVEAELARGGRSWSRLDRRDHDEDDRRCPLLSDEGRCLVYRARPLGCRTYYCGRASGPRPIDKRALQALAQRLDELTERTGDADDDARPLRSWIAGATDARRRQRRR